MYRPKPFRLNDLTLARELMREHPFATVVTGNHDRLEANHLPSVYSPQPAPLGSLRFHIASANPMHADLDAGAPVLLIFHGPHGYVSPDWYQSDDMVPTWNYLVVHVRGQAKRLDDAQLLAMLEAMSAQQERQLDKAPWRTEKLKPDLYQRLRRGIIGYEVTIATIDAKAKLGQNRHQHDLDAAIDAMENSNDPQSRSVAKWMQRLRPKAP